MDGCNYESSIFRLETLAEKAQTKTGDCFGTTLWRRRLCKAQGTHLLLVYVPCKEHVYWSRIWDPVDVNNILERSVTVTLSEGDHGYLQWEPKYIGFDTFNQNHNAQERLFQDMTDETGLEYLNLTPIFWQEAIQRGELYNYVDPHWNQAGNQLAADAIQAYLETH